jgi:DNA primase
MISQRTIDQVFNMANIVDVVADYVDLKKAGANYKGLCPFHNDHNPSFVVSPSKNICHCFVCGKGGNPVSFIMEKEGLTFPEAIRFLAKKYNIEVQEDKSEKTDQEIEEAKKRESMYIINQAVADFYRGKILEKTP